MGSLKSFQNPSTLVERFLNFGFSKESAAEKARLFDSAASRLSNGDKEAFGLFVPGRIEILGKHTDYAGGSSLVSAVEQGICFVVVPREDGVVRLFPGGDYTPTEFELNPNLTPSIGTWSNYPMTVARRLCRNFPSILKGADIAISGDLPPAAGMSSSSALMIGVFLALAEVNHLEEDPSFKESIRTIYDKAEYLGTIENGQSYRELKGDKGVGTFGGSEDHTAILCSEPGKVKLFSYCPTRFVDEATIPREYVFVIGVSGVVAEKTGAVRDDYNRASGLVSELVEVWNKGGGSSAKYLGEVLSINKGAKDELSRMVRTDCPKGLLFQDLLDRLDHFMAENYEITYKSISYLNGREFNKFGELARRSQRLAEDLLKNQVPQTAFLAHSAYEEGAVAASAFGAGFGGSVWALVNGGEVADFIPRWRRAYGVAHPGASRNARFLITRPAGGARKISE